MKNEKEIRSIRTEISLSEDGNRCQGYAIVFDRLSEDLGGFREIIRKEAVTEQMLREQDIFALFNHDEGRVLARCRYGEGSLDLTLDDRGLFYDFEIPNTAQGTELREHLRRGEMQGSSFAFWTDEDEWVDTDDGFVRYVNEIKWLGDVSPVFSPAYSDSTVAMRSLENKTKSDENMLKNKQTREEELIEETVAVEEPKEAVVEDILKAVDELTDTVIDMAGKIEDIERKLNSREEEGEITEEEKEEAVAEVDETKDEVIELTDELEEYFEELVSVIEEEETVEE